MPSPAVPSGARWRLPPPLAAVYAVIDGCVHTMCRTSIHSFFSFRHLLPRGIPLALPANLQCHRRRPSQAQPCMLLQQPHRRRSRPTRQDGVGGRGRSKGHVFDGACTTPYTDSAAATHTPPPPCMTNAKQRPKTTTTQLNRRYPVVLSAGVINRRLSEAPGN